MRNLSLNELCVQKLTLDLDQAGTQSALRFIRNAFEAEGLAAVALYGSQARGEASTDSDIDILLILSRPASRRDYLRWDEEVAPRIDPRISPAFVQWKPESRPSGLWLEIALDAKILWLKDPEIEYRLRELRNQIASGRFQRSYAHGQPYWTDRENP